MEVLIESRRRELLVLQLPVTIVAFFERVARKLRVGSKPRVSFLHICRFGGTSIGRNSTPERWIGCG